MKQKIIKSITLITFIALVSAFVTYRSGIIGVNFQTGSNGSTVKMIDPDSLSKKDSVKRRSMIPSSKVIIMTDQGIGKKVEKPAPEIDSSAIERIKFLGGSKSATQFIPSDFADTSKLKSKKK